jgi:regulator of protease activity HflC (stomatin/prohibitin superfamily)
MVRERLRDGFPGVPVLFLVLAGGIGLLFNVLRLVGERAAPPIIFFSIVGSAFLILFMLTGFFIVNPNEGRVLQFFGTYVGTSRRTGLQWLVPFYSKRRISLRVRSFESAHLKVNDKEGNPIEIGAVVVWKVVDTAEAAFEVDNYEAYVKVQSESALRNA